MPSAAPAIRTSAARRCSGRRIHRRGRRLGPRDLDGIDRRRAAERIPVRQERCVRVDLRVVAERMGAGVPQALRHSAGRQGGEPTADPCCDEQGVQRAVQDERGQPEEEPEEGHPAALPPRRSNIHVDRVAGPPREPRKRARDQKEKRADVRLVADVRREEAMQRRGRTAGHEREPPLRDQCEEGDDAPEEQPEDVRHRQEETEEGRQPRPAAVVVHRERHGMLGHRPRRGGKRRVGRRVRRRDEQEVRVRLRGVPEPIRGDVAKPVWHLASNQAREPAEEPGGQDDAAGDRKRAADAPGRPAAVHEREKEERRQREQ